MKIWIRKEKITLFPRIDNELIKCSECGSTRLHSIGDILECVDCKNVRALS